MPQSIFDTIKSLFGKSTVPVAGPGFGQYGSKDVYRSPSPFTPTPVPTPPKPRSISVPAQTTIGPFTPAGPGFGIYGPRDVYQPPATTPTVLGAQTTASATTASPQPQPAPQVAFNDQVQQQIAQSQ